MATATPGGIKKTLTDSPVYKKCMEFLPVWTISLNTFQTLKGIIKTKEEEKFPGRKIPCK